MLWVRVPEVGLLASLNNDFDKSLLLVLTGNNREIRIAHHVPLTEGFNMRL